MVVLRMKMVISLFFVFLCSLAFAGGRKDMNGLKQSDYDSNGWAYRDGIWIPSPTGANYRSESAPKEEYSEDIVYREISNVQNLEIAMDSEINGLDINGLTQKDYDSNGWAQKDGAWVASPNGALYQGSEDYNLEFLIASMINHMTSEEKGIIKITLLYGKDAKKEAENLINSPDKLAEYGKDVTAKWVAEQLDAAFTQGIGFVDALTGKWRNYGAQLDTAINDIIVTQMKVKKPQFTAAPGTIEGAIQRENWITEIMLDDFFAKMTINERKEFANIINEELQKEGIQISASASSALASGSLITLRKMLGFNFHIYIAKIANVVSRFIVGRGLSIPANALLQKIVGRIFGKFIPVIGTITLVWTIFDIPGMINPRNYDKFIPVVFMIGLTRLEQANT